MDSERDAEEVELKAMGEFARGILDGSIPIPEDAEVIEGEELPLITAVKGGKTADFEVDWIALGKPMCKDVAVFSPAECEALYEIIDAFSGGNASSAFAWDGTDSMDDPYISSMVKIFKAVGRKVPESCERKQDDGEGVPRSEDS